MTPLVESLRERPYAPLFPWNAPRRGRGAVAVGLALSVVAISQKPAHAEPAKSPKAGAPASPPPSREDDAASSTEDAEPQAPKAEAAPAQPEALEPEPRPSEAEAQQPEPQKVAAPPNEAAPPEPRLHVVAPVDDRTSHAAATPRTLPPHHDKRFLGLSLPAFLAFGAGGLGAGGALVTHMAASAPYSDPRLGCSGPCSDRPHNLALASNVLTGFAAAALGTGLVLAFVDNHHPQAALRPSLKLSLGPRKAGASAAWSF